MSSSDFKDSVKDLLSNNQFRIKKHLGQNFLKDRNILQKIVKEAKIDKNVGVIEVGPGLGSLTEFLIESANKWWLMRLITSLFQSSKIALVSRIILS